MDGLRLRGMAHWGTAAAVAYLVGLAWTNVAAADEAFGSGQVTFSKHIAPILFEHCAACHRPGEIGPFSLLTYESARKRADFLASITADRRMPPWKPDPSVGNFRHERRLSDAQIELFSRWAEAGAPEGNPADLPKPPEFVDGWQLGEPDLIVKMPESFTVPAGGPDIYRCFPIPIPLEEDRMVRAVEFRPGNASVVHHSIMFLDANHAARELSGKDGQPGYESFGGPTIVPTGGLGAWVPGAMPQPLPDGLALYLAKGSDLVLHMHYHPTGKAETDQSTVGIYFAKEPTKRLISGIAILQTDLHIPPGRRHHHILAESEPLPADVYVMGLTPHMHNLGREIKVTAVDPSGQRKVPLLWIKDWDFNWQGAYQFARPMRLPKGSKIEVRAYYDNSKHNPKNPNHPPKEVSWGEQTSDEMCLVSVQVFTETMDDLRQVAQMPAHELAAGIEGGVPAAMRGEVAAAKPAAGKKSQQPNGDSPKVAASKPATKQADAEAGDGEMVKFPADGIEVPAQARPLFRQVDADGNGRVTRQEVDALPEAARQRVLKNLTFMQSNGGS